MRETAVMSIAETRILIGAMVGEGEFIILGFADTSGSSPDNQKLSKSRAESVQKYLKDQGRTNHKTYAFGLGVSNKLNAAESRKNRAAEIWLAIPGEKP